MTKLNLHGSDTFWDLVSDYGTFDRFNLDVLSAGILVLRADTSFDHTVQLVVK